MEKKSFKVKLASKFAGWSMKKTVCVGLASAVVITGGAIGGIVCYRNMHSNGNNSDQQTAKVKVKSIEKNKKGQIKIPTYASCAISGDSVEKDLTLYITNGTGSDSKIAGTKFQIKLLTKDEAEKIKSADTKINVTKAYLKKAQELGVSDRAGTETEIEKVKALVNKELGIEKKSEEHHTDSKKESKKDSVKDLDISASTNKPVSIKESLILEEQKEIASFAKELSDLKGETYTDENSDGMIHIDKLEPGDYQACLVPVEEFDADQYAVGVKVKEKVEYKALKNIKKKVKKNAADKKKAGVPVEALLNNTLEFVNSSEKDKYEAVSLSGYSPNAANDNHQFDVESGSSSGRRRNFALNLLGLNTSLMSKRLATSTVAFRPTFWATENTNIDDNKTAVPNVFVKTSSTARVYASNNAAISSVSFGVEGVGCNITGVSTNSNGLSATLNGNTITITAHTSVKQDEHANVIVHTNLGNATATDVTIVGANTEVKYKNETVYTDSSRSKKISVENYSNQGYAKTGKIYYGWQTLDGKRYYFDKNGNKATGEQVINHIKYNFGSDGVLLVKGVGIDVSKWQGNINWSQVRGNVAFAIIRCGYRSSGGALGTDPQFARNMRGAKANGISTGVYFYSAATNEAEAVEEASLALDLVREQGGCSLPIYIDIEDGRQGSLSNAQRTAIVHAFCRTISSAGYRPGVYAGMNWWLHKLNHNELTQYSVWIARYNSFLSGGNLIWNGKTDIWQYSSKGSMPGINGNVDMNQSFF